MIPPLEAERIAKGPVLLLIVGDHIRNSETRAALFFRRVGPLKTEFDYWIAGFRFGSLFVFLQRYHWGQMRFTIEHRGKSRFARAWRWFRHSPSPVRKAKP